jgi:hypothetical protein
MELPRGYISYNQIRLYQQCPRLYQQKYVEGVDTPLDDKIYLGIIFHSAVEGHLKKRMAGQFCSAKGTVETYNQQFRDDLDKYPIHWRATKQDTRLRGEAMLKHYLKEIDPGIAPMMVEEEMEARIPETGILLRGILDLVEQDFTISDFKTATSRWSRERSEKSLLQMIIYRYLFESRFGPVTTRLTFRILYSRSTKTPRSQVISFPAAGTDFTPMFKAIQGVVEGIRTEAFHPRPSFRCQSCPFKCGCGSAKTLS